MADHFPVNIENSRRAYALLARKAPTTGIIFVHGFQGSPRGTWVDFQGLIEEASNRPDFWQHSDLIFYSYRSHDQIRPLAEDFLRFLLNIAVSKERLVSIGARLPSWGEMVTRAFNDFSDLRGTEPYKNLILVGHSTGAVIIREAIRLLVEQILRDNNATRDDASDHSALITNSRLTFFAPAHVGVLAAGKLGLVQSLPILDRIVGAFLRSNPLYQNLTHTSPTIIDLRKKTEEFYADFGFPALKAASLFGQHEEIVFVGNYSHDEVVPTEPGHNHVSICKPTHKYLKPLEFVANAAARVATTT